ncbi:CehA/McbA family metallohydrolase [Cohnella sp. JJ-181]|uniref:CehA/McbA family metallohydrolase n=1 Tax=Cohnella rhizoplanae TaxID=2974897 RepID=UPI0022FFBB80|nr:CehA/McbA family metallohydrolase [Cohnella sp. JJ-181]CAI6085752.1 hypothetical protein COHCIP112018_04780 [Cohnella sp. JJ-181]
MKWVASELHTHTAHSDGKQTLPELARGAKKLGYDCIALTDHNTMSGLADKEAVERETGLAILPGMEWTTFYGHMVTVGLRAFVDWRQAEPDNIRAGLTEIHRHGGVAGLAHPFRIGSPACTGCYWEFEVEDWNEFDYIEVWSTTFAPIRPDNRRAYALWTDRLNAGDRIAATSGRDWHEQKATDDPLSVTYLGIEDEQAPLAEQALLALRAGRVAVTLGPLLTLEIRSGATGRTYGIGAVVPAAADEGVSASCTALVSLQFSVREGLWELPPQSYRLAIWSNKGVVAERRIEATDDATYSLDIDAGDTTWTRAELWGVVKGIYTLIAFTNAIYFA